MVRTPVQRRAAPGVPGQEPQPARRRSVQAGPRRAALSGMFSLQDGGMGVRSRWPPWNHGRRWITSDGMRRPTSGAQFPTPEPPLCTDPARRRVRITGRQIGTFWAEHGIRSPAKGACSRERRPVLAAIALLQDGAAGERRLFQMMLPDRAVHRLAYTDAQRLSSACRPAGPRAVRHGVVYLTFRLCCAPRIDRCPRAWQAVAVRPLVVAIASLSESRLRRSDEP